MEADLSRLRDHILSSNLFATYPQSADAIDALLGERDEKEFDHEWTQANARMKNGVSNESDDIKELRRLSYEAVYGQTGHSDLAAYVSDDFGLIGEAVAADVGDEWINALWMSYKRGEIPRGALAPVGGRMRELI